MVYVQETVKQELLKIAYQSIVKEISPKYSLEGLMLKLQYFGHLICRLTHWKRL